MTKKAVEFLKQNQRSEYKRHREIYRPRGRCDVVVQTPRFNVNRITVKPGGAFSMQMHHHRAEHWVILAGTGGDGQRQAVPADREPVHLYSDWRRAQSGKPGPHSAGSAGDPVGVVPARTTLFVLKTSMVVANFFGTKRRMTQLTCFKAYDIRGELGEELNEDIAYRIGRAYGEFLKPGKIVVAMCASQASR